MSVLVACVRGRDRDAIRTALAGSGAEVLEVGGDRDTVIAAAARIRPDLCLVDPTIPGDGAAAAEAITIDDEIPVLLVVPAPGGSDLLAAARCGALGLLDPDGTPSAIARSVAAAFAGQAVVPRRLAARLLHEVRMLDEVHRGASGVTGDAARLAALTRREREVLDRLCDGESTARIARRLHVESVTVRSHVAAVLRKLHVADRDAAVAWMARNHAPERLRPVG